MESAIMQLWGNLNELSEDYQLNNITQPNFSRTTEEGVPIRKLFIGNLAERTTNKDLEKLFSNYGKVSGCYIKRNNGKSNFAFVTFSDVDGALKAREAGCKMEVQLHCRILRVSSADPWHQPDSIENQKRFNLSKNNNSSNSTSNNDEVDVDGSLTINDSAINMLNDDCLTEIFLYLPIADRIRMERVCKRWQAVSQECWREVKSLDLSKNTWGLSNKIRVQIIDTNTLRKVLIRCGKFLINLNLSQLPHYLSSSTLTIVGKFCPNLQIINITAIDLSPAGINALMNNCKNLYKFIMKSLTGPCEKDLSQLFIVNEKLKYLGIDGDDHIIGKCLSYLPIDIIEELHLNSCTAILSYYIDKTLDKLTKLRCLTLNSCVCITDSTLTAIGQKNTIINLELNGNHPMLTANAMINLTNLNNLQRLCLIKCVSITDTFLISLSNNCKQLKYLDISYCRLVTNKGVSSLVALNKLETLIINWLYQITDESIAELNSLKILKCLGCKSIRDPGVMNLIETANNLISLDLSSCSITNNTLETAIAVTKRRKNNNILKLTIGGTDTNVQLLTQVSPLLQIINVDLSILSNVYTNSNIRNLLDVPDIYDVISRMNQLEI